ncbi:hypothetical protein [Sphingomonas sp.]
MKRRQWKAALFAVLATGWAGIAHSRDQADDPAACTLHVWPSDGLGSVYSGWFHGGIVNGAVNGRDGYPPVAKDPLMPSAQTDAIAEAAPQRLIGDGQARLVVHDAPLPSRTARSSAGRIAADATGCYGELIVDDVTLRQDLVTGSHLMTLFRYRHFGDADLPDRSFGTWVKTKLNVDPAKDPNQAAPELRRAYIANFSLFADALARPARKR